MAAVTARELRALARNALAQAGARGFVRFAPEDLGALLLTDAPRFCADGAQRERLCDALSSRGFCWREEDGLLLITPGDALLSRLGQNAPMLMNWDWQSPLTPVYTLADRWFRAGGTVRPLTEAGRQLALETARLLWRPRAQVLAGLGALRDRAAVMQRHRDVSGLRLCAGMLMEWIDGESKEVNP